MGWAVARLTFRPVVIYAHGEELTTWGRGGKFKAMRFALRHGDRVIANSEHTRDTLLGMGVDRDRIAADLSGRRCRGVSAGARHGRIAREHWPRAGEKFVFSVGRLSRRKGFDRLIEAVAQLRRGWPAGHFALAGIGDDQDYLADHDRGTRVARSCALARRVERDDLPRWMNACDVFAMPNREIDGDNEGFGMVFIEAAACGKPDRRDGGWDRSGGQDGVTGFRVDGNDVAAVTMALIRLLADPELARRMGEAGLRPCAGRIRLGTGGRQDAGYCTRKCNARTDEAACSTSRKTVSGVRALSGVCTVLWIPRR